MSFDEDLTTSLTALAGRARPSVADPARLLKRHTVLQRRRLAARGSAVMAVTATGAVLTVSNVISSTGHDRLATGSSRTPTAGPAESCPQSPVPVPTPLATVSAAATQNGPKPTEAPNTPPPMPDQRIPARIVQAIDNAAPTSVTGACSLGDDIFFTSSAQGWEVDVAAAPWTGPLPTLGSQSRVIHRYANGDESRITATPKGLKVELWVAENLVTWTVDSSAGGIAVRDLESWSDRVHTVLT
jgi:hypothetical protein